MNQQSNRIEANRERNQPLVTELLFALFKQYSWLASVIIGGIIVLLQLGAVELNPKVFLSIAFLSSSILISLVGRDIIVDTLFEGKTVYDVPIRLKFMRYAAMACLGIGVGIFPSDFLAMSQ